MIPEAILAGACAVFSTPVLAAGYWGWRRTRARRRNAADLCARCSGPLYTAGTGEGPSLVEGRLHCAHCAARLRLRTHLGLLALGGWGASSLLAAGVVAWSEGAVAGLGLGAAVVAQTAVYGGGAVAYMRRRNRLALRELEARGEALPPVPASVTSGPGGGITRQRTETE
ncbi:MAG TPA: hypothetical protein VF263_09805 [Longimicrobiaceae bacterium]